MSDRLDTLGTVLVVAGVAALLLPALFPVQQVLYHETRAGTTANESQLERQGYTVVSYRNLSARGQEIYVAALETGGEYTVPVGEGAAEFPYQRPANSGEIEEYERRRALTSVVIERPDDADLPPPDEPVEAVAYEAEEREGSVTRSELEQRQQRTARYDLMTVRQGTPPLTASSNLLRLGAALFGVVAIGVGGYLRASPRRA